MRSSPVFVICFDIVPSSFQFSVYCLITFINVKSNVCFLFKEIVCFMWVLVNSFSLVVRLTFDPYCLYQGREYLKR